MQVYADKARALVDKARATGEAYVNNATEMGKDAVNRFIVEAGFQGSLDSIPIELRNAVIAGMVAGKAEVAVRDKLLKLYPAPGTFVSTENPNEKISNDLWAIRGQRLLGVIKSNPRIEPIKIGNSPVINIRNAALYNGTDKISDLWRRGFDIGIGVCAATAEASPTFRGHVRASLVSMQAWKGFDAAQSIQTLRAKFSGTVITNVSLKGNSAIMDSIQLGRTTMLTRQDRQQLEDWARTGASLASRSTDAAEARAVNSDGNFRWGFDIGTAVCQGTTDTGPSQNATRAKLGPQIGNGGPSGAGSTAAQNGFDVAMALQHGRAKIMANTVIAGKMNTVNAATRAGLSIAAGMAGSSTSPDVKQAVAQTVLSSGSADLAKGLAVGVKAKLSIWHKLAVFFGLSKK